MSDKQQSLNKSPANIKTCPLLHSKNGPKNRNTCQSIRLKPLSRPDIFFNKKRTPEEDLLPTHRLDAYHNVSCDLKKKTPSKIPVLKRCSVLQTDKHKSCLFDSTLSAADRREKYHQSKKEIPRSKDLAVVPVIQSNITPVDVHHISPERDYHFSAFRHHQKVILPSIKTSNSVTENAVPQVKKKCLMGEITHFPALCISTPKQVRNSVASSVPRLPPISTILLAPPPSISSSLEQDFKRCNPCLLSNNEKKF